MGTWILRILRIKTDFGGLRPLFFDFLRINPPPVGENSRCASENASDGGNVWLDLTSSRYNLRSAEGGGIHKKSKKWPQGHQKSVLIRKIRQIQVSIPLQGA
jgi:hypothetical protein